MSDFTQTPYAVMEETPRYSTLISNFENGVEQRRAKWASPIREFTLTFRNMTSAEYVVMKNFFIAKLGAYTTFTWTNPNDSVEYTVRFKDDSLKITRRAYQVYDYDATFIVVK